VRPAVRPHAQIGDAFVVRPTHTNAVTLPAARRATHVPPTGVKSAGVKSAGGKTGVKSAGVKSAGVTSVGVKSAGVKNAGVQTAGVKTAGVKTAGGKIITAGVKSGHSHLRPGLGATISFLRERGDTGEERVHARSAT